MIDVFIFIGWVRPECILIVDKTFSSKLNVMTTFQSCYSDALNPAFFVTGLGKKTASSQKKGHLHNVCLLFSFSIWIRHVRLCNRGFFIAESGTSQSSFDLSACCVQQLAPHWEISPASWLGQTFAIPYLGCLISRTKLMLPKTPSDNPWRRSEERFASLYRHQPQRNKGLKSFPRWVKNFEA